MDESTLTAADRCDRCPAQAKHVTHHTFGELLWCEHHYREHAAKLELLPAEITFERMR